MLAMTMLRPASPKVCFRFPSALFSWIPACRIGDSDMAVIPMVVEENRGGRHSPREGGRAAIAQRRVGSAGVVEALDEAEDFAPCLGHGREPPPIKGVRTRAARRSSRSSRCRTHRPPSSSTALRPPPGTADRKPVTCTANLDRNGWITGPFGWRVEIAIFSASPTSSAGIRDAIAQPTIRRLQASSTTARYSQPAPARTCVMSAIQNSSGPSAERSRFTRSGAAFALASRFVVPVLKRPRVTPSMPSPRIRRPTRSPPARSAAWIRGQP